MKDKKEHYGFKCLKSLKDRVEAIARKRGHGDKSDIATEALLQFLRREEKKLGIHPTDGRAA